MSEHLHKGIYARRVNSTTHVVSCERASVASEAMLWSIIFTSLFIIFPSHLRPLNFLFFPLTPWYTPCYRIDMETADSAVSDTAENPLLKARQELGFTQFDVADEVGVTRNFIVRAESGEYPHAPQNLVSYYAGGDKSKAIELTDQYNAFRTVQRKLSFGLLYPYFNEPEDYLVPGVPGMMHPLLYWTKRTAEITPGNVPTYPLPSSLYAICRAFCVHHAVMYKWTKGESSSVPKIFLDALFVSGYDEGVLIDLEGAYRMYLESR